jgi:broad specificity phosphatase PhoE
MSIVTRWWWIRHAPVPDGGRIYGQSDLECDCSDVDIFRILARELPRDAVWATSNLVRTKQTAAAILAADAAGRLAGIEPLVVPHFAEQHLGVWQGQERKAFYAERQVGTHTLWFAPADERPPGGESFVDLVQRVVPAIERLNSEHAGRDIVAVTHGGTIRAAVGHALGLPPQAALGFSTDNCSLTRLDHLSAGGKGLWRVVAVNHRPWSRTPAAEQMGHNPVAIDKA